MTWNYRVIRSEYKCPDGTVEVTLGIHEVYYDSSGVPELVTERAVGCVGDDLAELGRVLDMMCAALSKPMLDAETLAEVKG